MATSQFVLARSRRARLCSLSFCNDFRSQRLHPAVSEDKLGGQIIQSPHLCKTATSVLVQTSTGLILQRKLPGLPSSEAMGSLKGLPSAGCRGDPSALIASAAML